jgi:hypothetical protein
VPVQVIATLEIFIWQWSQIPSSVEGFLRVFALSLSYEGRAAGKLVPWWKEKKWT